MSTVVQASDLFELAPADAAWAGSKATRLGRLAQAGFAVPAGLVIGADAYQRFVEETGIVTSIQLLLHRKRFEDMRWEELWDLSLRVRNLFARAAMPPGLQAALRRALRPQLVASPVVVRSAGLSEDSQTASFAGLHDSFSDVRGIDEVLEKIVLVWSSLWSDRALLYRQELRLDPRQSRIAVIVQRFVVGRASGVSFSRSPGNGEELLVEAVWGLNQGLVDGTVPPHRWHLDRHTGAVKRCVPAEQRQALRATASGARLVDLDPADSARPPLQAEQLATLHALVTRIEGLFSAPQDVEWTLAERGFVVLQSRPITAGGTDGGGDDRRWYLTLHRSIENLEQLRRTIEQELLPGMQREAEALAAVDLGALDAPALVAEVRRRQAIRQRWIDAYWQHCIPFAHGMRLFGQVYNDHCKPEDPFEFVQLLRSDDLLGTQRNAAMQLLAADLRAVQAGGMERATFDRRLDDFLRRFGLTSLVSRPAEREALLALLARLRAAAVAPPADAALRQRFLDRFADERRAAMAALLDLARDSYRLRDDDNIYLGRIEAQLAAAVSEAARRVDAAIGDSDARVSAAELIQLLEDPALPSRHRDQPLASAAAQHFELRARQLVGQPASPGLAVGRARVIAGAGELLSFCEGEILICDAIDPNMTFVAPLAAGIVERRGGMLIHGAIIAREYRVPCVTGVPDATSWIRTGDTVTVDGHLGLVTVSARAS